MTDDNGKAILNIKLKNNKYSVTISFAGDPIYKSSSKKLTFTVCNAPAMSLNAYSSPYKSGKTFNIKVFNTKTNKIIVGINLKIKVYTSSNYKIYTVTTEDGVAKFGASSLSIGLHNIHVYSGDQYVKFNKVKSIIKISKANTIVSAPKVINVYKVKSYFKVTVKHKSSCKIISNLKICIKVYTGSKYKTYTIIKEWLI